MTFEEVLAQIIEVLQQEKRISYRALKRRFDLDDEYLADLKEELIYAKQLAVDEEERVLVWTAHAGTPSETELLPDTSTVAALTPAAERRQLTVMFCDLVESTTLSIRFDPEDYRDIVRAYQATCAEVVQHYGGHIAQTLGDGLLIYCGYPVAHENDAVRAVRVGLGILEAMRDLNERLEQTKGIRLALRVGIHTGLVVVGEVGAGSRPEQLALGETPNIAARIQGVAASDTVVISDDTYQLAQGYFNCQALGERQLRGTDQPIALYQVLQASGARSRWDISSARGLTPLVGRDSEVELLLERWAQVKDGQGQVVLLSGEAGIGKSRLVEVLQEHIADEPHIQFDCRCSPYHQNTALYPIIDVFQQTLRFEEDESTEDKFHKLETALGQYRLCLNDVIPLFTTLLSLPLPEDRYPAPQLTPQQRKQRTLETLMAMVLEVAEHQPVLFILEDVHWADATTLELLNILLDQSPTTAIYTLLTCRPEFQLPWGFRAHLTPIALHRLTRGQVEEMVERMTGGRALPPEVVQQIVEKTDAVPLYVEECTKAVLESEFLQAVDDHYELTGDLPALTIPATLYDSLMSRLDRLVTAKGVAQLAATIGRQFSYALLQAIALLDAETLQRELGKLVEAELVYQKGMPPQATYMFKHALVADLSYQSLMKTTRQQYHQRVATSLTLQFPELSAGQPELVAYHYTEAGLHDQAIRYWRQAGQQAIERSAYVEAIAHLTQGLEALESMADTAGRAQHELDLQILLGQAFMASKGHTAPEVEQTYLRARDLCEQVGDVSQLVSVLSGLRRYYQMQGAYQIALEVGEQLLHLAQQHPDPAVLMWSHLGVGPPLLLLGNFPEAARHLEKSLTLAHDHQDHPALTARFGTNPRVSCLSWSGLVAWLVGYPDQAKSRCQEALHLAEQLSSPFTLTLALTHAIYVHQCRREASATLTQTDALIAVCTEQHLPSLLAFGMVWRGWALAMEGQVSEGIEQIRQGMRDHQARGAQSNRTVFLALLVDVYKLDGQVEAGLRALDEALVVVDQMGERWYEAELHRLRGELLLCQSPDDWVNAATCFRHSLDIARGQEARSWELRTATSLARLWQSQGTPNEARELLTPVCEWFTEGFDTADLQDAWHLLEELAT